MTVRLSFADWLVIIAYFVAVVFVGFRAARKAHGHIDEYLVAGRGLTLPVFIATLVSTWYGGILGVGEFSYRYGISNWFIFGVPYYFFAILFAIFLAPRVRQAKLHTIPDKLRESYGGATAAMGSFLTLFIVTPAPYVLMVGIILEMISGWSLTVSVIVTTVASIIYLYSGGLHSDVRTNTVEFVLMYIGFGVILPFCFTHYGGLSFIRTHVPPGHLTVTGGNSWQYIIAWFFIASWTLIDPAFHQRCYAAKSGSVARYGILLSVIFWLFFDFMTSMTGLYARAIVPNLNQPAMSYPALAEVVLPSFVKGLFYVGMLATIMSSLESLTFISAVTIGKDILFRFLGIGRNDRAESKSILIYSQIGIIITAIISIAISLLLPSVIQIWYDLGSVFVPGLLIPLVTSYFPTLRVSSKYVFLSMTFGWLTSLLWLISGFLYGGTANSDYILGVQPMYPGLFLSGVFYLIGYTSRVLHAGTNRKEGGS
ncbi:MAG: sodium:solute symporter family protein [Candidatus Kryptoniota bacterium]